MTLKGQLEQSVAEFDAALKSVGLRLQDRICECGCYEAGHDADGKCVTNYRGCRCPQFRELKPPTVNPFTTAEHYMRDRKGTWTGD